MWRWGHCHSNNSTCILREKIKKDEIEKLESIYDKAKINEVEGISRVSKEYVNNQEPLINCYEALEVKSTGIVDQQALMRAYVGDLIFNYIIIKQINSIWVHGIF